MPRYGDFDELLEAANDLWADKVNLYHSLTNEAHQLLAHQELIGHAEVVRLIKEAPTADVAPVVHGRWVQGDYYDFGDVCSNCDWDSERDNCKLSYCPNCGAKMDLKEGDS